MFTVVESDGGRVVAAEVVGTAGLEHRLWLIARDRRLSIEPLPSRSCPTCEAPLIANFRWCQSCGTDFEPWRVEPTSMPALTVRPAAAQSEGTTQTATLERPAETMASPAREAAAPPTASTAAGVTVFVLDPRTAATASIAAPASPVADAPPATIGIASNRLPPAPRHVAPPPASRGIGARLANALDGSPFDARMILLGVVVGLSIGVIVTLALLALE